MSEERAKLKTEFIASKLTETMTEGDLARCLHYILSETAHRYRKSLEEVADAFVKLSGDLDAIKFVLSQKYDTS